MKGYDHWKQSLPDTSLWEQITETIYEMTDVAVVAECAVRGINIDHMMVEIRSSLIEDLHEEKQSSRH